MKPSKVLRAAADLLDKGWCQGVLGLRLHPITAYGVEAATHVGTDGFKAGAEIDRLCLMGALMKAVVDGYGTDWPVLEGDVIGYACQTPISRAMTASYLNAERAVEREIKARIGVPVADVVMVAVWNDRKDVTQAEVVDVVRTVARREEEAGR